MENEEFAKESYDRVRAIIHSKNNYYAMLIYDQMIKNNKATFKLGKKDCENLFKGVWEKCWHESKDSQQLENLKLMVKVWGYIFGPKYEENLKKWIENTFKTKFTIPSEKEHELKEIYGLSEQPKTDSRM
jgi:hypothetical protein